MIETPLMTRRRFFQALAASVVATGLPLPVGLPLSAVLEPSYESRYTYVSYALGYIVSHEKRQASLFKALQSRSQTSVIGYGLAPSLPTNE